jgi:UDP-N-acetyl-2-amino-2-deoxyglucuronate dehydrogenase
MVISLGLLRFGLAGCGQVAHKHAFALKQLQGGQLVSVQDPDPKIAKEFGDKYRVPYFTSYEQLLTSGIDVVSICSPSWLHASMGIEAAVKGIHVLVEKPMALSLKDADALITACTDNNVYLSVVLQNRFKPAVRLLHSALERGRFGLTPF